MPKMILRLYEELNDCLPPHRRKKDFEVRFDGRVTPGRILDELGIPHGEVDLVLVNGESVDFDHVLLEGDRVSIYPVFERFDIGGVGKLRSRPLRNLKFVAEKDLGEVAARLGSLGFDVLWESDLAMEKAIRISRDERRVLLVTREDVLGSGTITHGLYVGPGPVENQVFKILRDLDLQNYMPDAVACSFPEVS